ncbi:MAG TPA: DUF6635 family protein [Acetobacteraceae bacterium]|jgi:hypothetical protein
MQNASLPDGTQTLLPDAALAGAIVRDGIARYIVTRHERIDRFVTRHFSLSGTLRLHRAALGWDIARAPLNLVMAAPQAGVLLAAAAARRLGAKRAAEALRARPLIRRTAVAREVAWLVQTELLELPARYGAREARRDALAETIVADPRLIATLKPMLAAIEAAGMDPTMRARIEAAVADYAGTRAASAEITTALLSLGTGAAALSKLTPGAMTLGPALAAMLAQQAAVSSFPLGGALGSLWYGAFPAAPSAVLVAGLTGGLMAGAAVGAAFAGIVADPVQRRLGLHQRRLHRLLGALERQLLDPRAPGFAVHDHYVARLLDLFDLVGAAYRLTVR